MRGSAHYTNDACDVRTHPLPSGAFRTGCIVAGEPEYLDEIANTWGKSIKRKLGKEYTVIYEKNKQHIHVEFDKGE